MKKYSVIVKQTGSVNNTYITARAVRTDKYDYLLYVIRNMAKENNASTQAFKVFDMVSGEEYILH